MTEFSLPWISLLIFIHVSAIFVGLLGRGGRGGLLVAMSLAFLVDLLIFVDFQGHDAAVRMDPWLPFLRVDSLLSSVLPFVGLLLWVTTFIRPRKTCTRQSLTLFTLSSLALIGLILARDARVFAVLWLVGSLLFLVERGRQPGLSIRVPALYLGLSAVSVLVGAWLLAASDESHPTTRILALFLLVLGASVRKGLLPFQSWVPDSFQRGPFASTLLFCTPQVEVILLVRLVLPVATPEIMSLIGGLALLTAVYAAAASSVQNDARRCFAYLFMSQTALVMAGITSSTVEGLTGALCLWLSGGMALTGMGLTLWLMEARHGRLDLSVYRGGYESKPLLATGFLLLGLASVGFPGTLGFVAQELLIEGEVVRFPILGFAVIVASGLCGITVLRMFFALFCGKPAPRLKLRLQRRQLVVVILLVAILYVFGLLPSAFVDKQSLIAGSLLAHH